MVYQRPSHSCLFLSAIPFLPLELLGNVSVDKCTKLSFFVISLVWIETCILFGCFLSSKRSWLHIGVFSIKKGSCQTQKTIYMSHNLKLKLGFCNPWDVRHFYIWIQPYFVIHRLGFTVTGNWHPGLQNGNMICNNSYQVGRQAKISSLYENLLFDFSLTKAWPTRHSGPKCLS